MEKNRTGAAVVVPREPTPAMREACDLAFRSQEDDIAAGKLEPTADRVWRAMVDAAPSMTSDERQVVAIHAGCNAYSRNPICQYPDCACFLREPLEATLQVYQVSEPPSEIPAGFVSGEAVDAGRAHAMSDIAYYKNYARDHNMGDLLSCLEWATDALRDGEAKRAYLCDELEKSDVSGFQKSVALDAALEMAAKVADTHAASFKQPIGEYDEGEVNAAVYIASEIRALANSPARVSEPNP